MNPNINLHFQLVLTSKKYLQKNLKNIISTSTLVRVSMLINTKL